MDVKDGLLWIFSVAAIISAASPIYCQQVSKEYIRLGSQVIAIENAGAPTLDSVTVATGSPLTITIKARDYYLPNNSAYTNIAEVDLLINFWLTGVNSCYVEYFAAAGGGLRLMNDAGNGWSAVVPLSSANTLHNSQCQFTSASASGSGNNLTLTYHVSLTSNPNFQGTQVLWAGVIDAQNRSSGWQPLSTYAVSAASGNPTVSGMTPPTGGTGWSQTFVFSYADLNNWPSGSPGSLVDVLMNNSLNGISACYVAFVRPNLLYLVDDAGDSAGPFAGSLTLPSSGTVSNSQCTLSASYTWNGANLLTLTLNMTFKGSFGGPRLFYSGAVSNGVSSGWQAIGWWAVP